MRRLAIKAREEGVDTRQLAELVGRGVQIRVGDATCFIHPAAQAGDQPRDRGRGIVQNPILLLLGRDRKDIGVGAMGDDQDQCLVGGKPRLDLAQ